MTPHRYPPLDIPRIRQETAGVQHVYHFNNAGCSLPPNIVIDRMTEFLHEEAITGGYTMSKRKAKELQQVYVEAARLINCSPDEIAFIENASVGFNKALFALPWKAGDIILTSGTEYSTNYLNYMKLRDEKGVEIRLIPFQPQQAFDSAAFESLIDERVKLIAITHVPTQSGYIAPAAAIGRIAKKYQIPYLLDACQSVGQLPIDVQEIQCDFLSTTSRKYIRGPRGAGFLYVSKKMLPLLNPTYFDLLYTEWKAREQYDFQPSAKIFENWEKSGALMVGLAAALAYANRQGIHAIWERVQSLSQYLRNALEAEQGLLCCDPGRERCGIITLQKEGMDCQVLKQALARSGINTSVSSRSSSFHDMESRGLEEVLRASVHYFNTEEEIDYLIQKLRMA